DRRVLNPMHRHANTRRRFGLLAGRSYTQAKYGSEQDERDYRCGEQPEPQQWIAISRREAFDPRRVRGAAKHELEENARESDCKKIDRDADDHLIRTVPDRCYSVDEREHGAAANPT